jgi:hypothetical protein
MQETPYTREILNSYYTQSIYISNTDVHVIEAHGMILECISMKLRYEVPLAKSWSFSYLHGSTPSKFRKCAFFQVFQCYKASCGHFYHPSCIAKLLEPDDTDGACKLEKKIAAGMSFTCPVHWCSKCGKMEDSAHKAQWLAVCRRCPVSYHKKCLPRCSVFWT